MEELQVELIDGRFDVNEMLGRFSKKTLQDYKNTEIYESLIQFSKKTLQDYKNTEIYESLIQNDPSAIMNGLCKKEYFNSLLYWANPKIAFLIENKMPWRHLKEPSMKEGGCLYLIKISEHGFFSFSPKKIVTFLIFPQSLGKVPSVVEIETKE